MRTLATHILCLSLLILGSAAQAPAIAGPVDPPPIVDISELPLLAEFHFFFQHLVNLDSAAAAAEAEDSSLDASSWRTLDQRAAGLTDPEGAILKEAAQGCVQALRDYETEFQAAVASGGQPLTDPLQIVASAVEGLRSQLGEAAFQTLSDYVHVTFGPEIEVVSSPPGSQPPGTATIGSEEPTVEATAGPSISVFSHISKLSNQQVLAECATQMMDNETRQKYRGTDVLCTLYSNSGLPPSDVPCPNDPSICINIFPAFPGVTYQTQGGHDLWLYSTTCAGNTPGLSDPLHYCGAQGSPIPVFQISGTVYPQGDPVCWLPNQYGACGIAQTIGRQVTFVDIQPIDVTLTAKGQQRFSTNIPAVLRLTGPGTLDGTGLYNAPETLSGPQTAQIQACDANPTYRDDCLTATIHLDNFKLEVAPTSLEALPLAEVNFTATVTPSTTGQTVTWSLTDPTNAASIKADASDSTKALFTAPPNDKVPDPPPVITIKACVKINSVDVCGTAQVTVPQMHLSISASKTKIAGGETLQLTATVFGSSTQPRELQWFHTPERVGAELNVITADTLVAAYKAAYNQPGPVDIKACFKDSPKFCSDPFQVEVTDLTIDSITGDFNAGELAAPFTVHGSGFGLRATVTFPGLQATVTSSTDSVINGVVMIPVAQGGATTRATVTAYYSSDNKDYSSTVFPPPGTPGIPIVPVSLLAVSPGSASLQAGESQTFSAICLTAKGAACSSPEIVRWSASQGTIDPTGNPVRYTAPASVQSDTAATVTACWGVSGPCAPPVNVTLRAGTGVTVNVTPETATVFTGQTKQFTAQVTGTTNTAVTWSITPATPEAGRINQSGLYTAPATLGGVTTVTVTATSQADSTRSDTATVTLVRPPVTLTCTPSPAFAATGSAITWTATATGLVPATTQYALFRRKVGTGPDWTPPATAPAWQAGNVLSWTPAPDHLGTWEIIVWVKDGNTPANENGYGFAAYCNPGPVQVVGPPSVTSTPSPAYAYLGTTLTWTATGSGGVPGTLQYALFRRKVGTGPDWTPPVTSPAWQAGNELSWTPGAGEVGTWEIIIWVKDSITPPDLNGFGFAGYTNPGPVQVVAPPTVTSTPSPTYANHGSAITWTATGSGGVPGTLQYALFRRKVGTGPDWTPPVTSPNWQSGNVLSWTPDSSQNGTWEIVIWVRDSITPPTMNGYGFAGYTNAGPVQVVTPLSITCSVSPSSGGAGTGFTVIATPSGGAGTIQYAFFRRRAGTVTWTPDVTAPAWQTGNSSTWTPAAPDIGTWENYVWARDATTKPNSNGYGYSAGCNPGPIQVLAPLTVTATASPSWVNHGTGVNWTATASGGNPANYQYALLRRRVGTTAWTPPETSPAWQTSNVLSWLPGSSDVGTWEISVRARDGNTTAAYNPGAVQVVAPLTVTGTGSPPRVYYSNPITWTATASGGTGTGRQYAFFRKKVGTTNWIPAVTSPAWQSGNVLSWTPTSAEAGTWETSIWVKDNITPPGMNNYGFAAYYNPGAVQVFAPPVLSVTPTPASATYGTPITWTASVSGGITPATYQYALFRRRAGTASWIPAVTSPAWQFGNVLSWTPAAADVGTWEIYFWVKDGNTPPGMHTYGYAAGANGGTVEVAGPLTITCGNPPVSATYGTPVTWSAYAGGGHTPSIQYAFFRRRVGSGTAGWIPAVTSPAWQSGNSFTWTPGSADVGTWETYAWVRDANTPANMNTYGYAAGCNSGTVQVVAPLSLTGTGSPGSANCGEPITWTAYANGGYPPTRQYALFRRLAGTSSWIPALTSPAWQSSNFLSWTPSCSDLGTWEIVIWVKDGNTPPTMNGYGFAAYYNAGPVQVVEPLSQWYAPHGWVDGFDSLHVWGWACDPDYPWESNRVDLWTTSWQWIGSAEANGWSSAPINSACGGGNAHYFDFYHWGGILPGTVFWVWSIDLPYATPGNDNRPIGGFGSTGSGYEFVMP